MGVTVRTKIPGKSGRNAGQQGKGGLSLLWMWVYYSTQVFYGKFCPQLANISTMWLGEVPEFQLLGVEVFEARRQIYKLQIICYLFSVSYKWLSKTKFSIPNWAFKNKNRTFQRAYHHLLQENIGGNEPFLKDSVMARWLSKVTGD